jgi:hypothetical protein
MIYAQNININFSDGTSSSYALNDISKITFTEDLMNLHFIDGSISSLNIFTIKNYIYDYASLVTKDSRKDFNADIFPNPTYDLLKISYSLLQEDEIIICLYDLQGKLVLKKVFEKRNPGIHQESIKLDLLPQGNYLCHITGKSGSIIKRFIKN